METVAIAIIGTVVFGAVTTLAAFIRQLLLSRDKHLNDKAQHRALEQEIKALETMRDQIIKSKRFDAYYSLLDTNNSEIEKLDQKIEAILEKKFALIQKYSDMTVSESLAIVDGKDVGNRKEVCDLLHEEIDLEMAFYDKQLDELQKRRGTFLESHKEVQHYLLEQEKNRNDKLDEIYQRHTSLLEKIYIRHNENSEHIARKSIDSSMQTFKLISIPFQMLMNFFRISSNIDPSQFDDELSSRINVSEAENDINYNHSDDLSQNDDILEEYSDSESGYSVEHV